jgi:hypothetical protein
MNHTQLTTVSQAATDHGTKQFRAWRLGDLSIGTPLEELETFYSKLRDSQMPGLPMWENLSTTEQDALLDAYLMTIPKI